MQVYNDVRGNQYNTFNNQVPNNNLWDLNPVNMDAASRIECLPDTRLDILSFMKEFVSGHYGEQNVMWLHGVAGSGKSTVATTIANYFRERGRLGAFLFFNRDIAERSNPAMVVRTLAYQLGSSDQRIGAAMSAVMSSISSIAQSPIRLQFSKLLVEPLSSVEALQTGEPLVVVLDALDECGNTKTRQNFLEILSQESVHLHKVLRIIITSRPEIDIKKQLSSQPHVLARELDITSDDNVGDVKAYIRKRMAAIQQDNACLSLPPNWPGDVRLSDLSARASGLFIWASVACNFIEDGHYPEERLEILLQAGVAAEAQSALDSLYRTALGCSGKWNDPVFGSEFRAILGVILIARNPLSCSSIDGLLMTAGRPSLHTISRFGCVLRWKDDGPVRILHPSFADFLSNRDRCGSDTWFVDTVSANRAFVKNCLQRLDQSLRKNICNLTLSQAEVNQNLPADVSYACVSWISHVCVMPLEDGVPPSVENFMVRHFLHWFEAMAILKMSWSTTTLLGQLYNRIQVTAASQTATEKLIGDAHRFSQAFSEFIKQHPLLVYTSALPFTPTNTDIYRTLRRHDDVPWVAGGPQQWSQLLLVILGHSASVVSVAFSPDGERIASGSGDMTVRVWDATTGITLVPPLLGHKKAASFVTWSPDGLRIAASSYDAVRIWDANTGSNAAPPLLFPEGMVHWVTFSPNSTLIASCSFEIVRVWNANSGVELLKLKPDHLSGRIRDIAFSPDVSCIVTRDRYSDMGWDMKSRLAVPVEGIDTQVDRSQLMNDFPIGGTDDGVLTIDMSPDGRRLVSGSRSGVVRVWDTQLQDLPPLPLPHLRGTSLLMSPDGSRIVVSSGPSMRTWSAISGVELPALGAQSSSVRFAIFSPSGHRVVCLSDNHTIRMWDSFSGAQLFDARSHRGVKTMAFSLDETFIACGLHDGAIRVIDAGSGKLIFEPHGRHAAPVLSVAYSPNGSHIVSGSMDKSVHVWEGSSGFASLEGHRAWVCSASFSPNGKHIVSASEDGNIRRWDVLSGVMLGAELFTPAIGVIYPNIHVVFSSDGEMIICRVANEMICLYDSDTGHLRFSTKMAGYSVTHHPQRPIVITDDGWIVDVVGQVWLSKLPPTILPTSLVAIAACTTAITITTSSELFVMHFVARPCSQDPKPLKMANVSPSFIHDPDAPGESGEMSRLQVPPLRLEEDDVIARPERRGRVSDTRIEEDNLLAGNRSRIVRIWRRILHPR